MDDIFTNLRWLQRLLDAFVQLYSAYAVLITPIAVTLLAMLRCAAIGQLWKRPDSARAHTDMLLKMGWVILLSVLSLCVAVIASSPFPSPLHKIHDILRISVDPLAARCCLIALVSSSCVAAPAISSPHLKTRRNRLAICVGVMLLLVVSWNRAMSPAMTAIAVQNINMGIPYSFKSGRLAPAPISPVSSWSPLLPSVAIAIALFALHMFYHLRIHRDKTPPLRKHGLFSFLTLAGCVALIAFIDVALAPDIVHSLSAGMVSRNALRLLVALIVVSPVAAAIARRTLVRRNSIVTLEGSDNSWSRFLSRAEFTMIGLLSIAAYTELHMATHGRGSLWVVHWHAVSPEHALFCFMALLACVRASGRWVNMHWSCRLQAPNQFVVQLPIRAWMLLTALTMLQLLTLAYLIGWTTLLALWPLALSP